MAKVTITICDDNINDGTVTTDIVVEQDSKDDGLMTGAHIYAKFLEAGMTDPDFLGQVWAFAEHLIDNHPGASILNDNFPIDAPVSEANAA